MTETDSAEKLGLLNVKYVFSRNEVSNSNFKLIKNFENSYLYENKKFIERFFIKDSNESIAVLNYSPDNVKLSANSSGNLVFSDVFYPGWHAYVNDKEVPVYPYQNLTKYIFLESNENDVEFIFNPKIYFYGEFITFSTLLILVLIFFFRIKRKLRNSLTRDFI